MRVVEIIEHALITSGLARKGEVPNDLHDFALDELNRIYYEIYNLYPWDNTKIFNLTVTTTTGTVVLPQTVEYVRAARIDTQPLPPVDELRVANVSPSTFDDTGDPINFMYRTRTPVATQPAAATTIRILSSSATDTGTAIGKVRIEGTVGGENDFEELTLNGTSNVDGTKSFTEILEITKPKTVGRISIKQTDGTVLGSIAPWDQQGHYKRIEILPNPDESVTVTLLCTRKFMDLVSDDDSILIPEAESGIIHFLTAALLEFGGDPQKAQIYEAKGATSIQSGAFSEQELNDRDFRSLPAAGMFGDLGTETDSIQNGDISITGVGL